MHTPDESGFGKAITLKCYEVSYALVRIAKNASRSRFAEHLEDLALELLRTAAARSSRDTLKVLEGILYIVRLGSDTGVLNSANSALVVREAEQLVHAMSEYGHIEDARVFAKEEDLSGVFTEFPELDSFFRNKGMRVSYGESATSDMGEYAGLDDIGGGADEPEIILEEQASVVPEVSTKEERRVREDAMYDAVAAPDRGQDGKNRQARIVELIRQIAQCKMKDLQENLPGVSERTIRYDIQTLIEQGTIERIGSSGPATFYQVRQ
jgi:hypothetical protein